MTKAQKEQLRNLKALSEDTAEKQIEKLTHAKELEASVKEAEEIERGERQASRFYSQSFTVNLCKDQELARGPMGYRKYKLDVPVGMAAGDSLEIHIDAEHSEKE